MQEYSFKVLSAIRGHIKDYKNFPLPVIIVDTNFKICFCNNMAEREKFSAIFSAVIQEVDKGEMLGQITKKGCVTFFDIIPLSGMRASVLPVRDEVFEVIAFVFVFMGSDAVPSAAVIQHSGRNAATLSNSTIKAMERIFSVMDTFSAKAELMDNAWINAGYNYIGLYAYKAMRSTHNIAVYTSLQNGDTKIPNTAVDVFTLLRGWEKSLALMADEVGVPLRFFIDDEPEEPNASKKAVYANINIEKFGIVLANILHNALYFTRVGNEVTVTAQSSVEEGTCVITVSDKGIGISEEILPQIFRPYTAGTPGETMGIGLSLCKLYIDILGGDIEVTSVEGKGTDVTVRLPIAKFSSMMPFSDYRRDDTMISSRFSPLCIGIADAAVSPHRES